MNPPPEDESKSYRSMRDYAALGGALIREWIIILALSIVVTSCSIQERIFILSSTEHVSQPFYARGLLSVNIGAQGYFANFEWRHQLEHDQLAIRSTMGHTIVEVIRDAGGVKLLTGEKKIWQSTDVKSLTERILGSPLSFPALTWWIRGIPDPGSASQLQPDGDLLQQGWRIRFVRDIEVGTPYPNRVDLSQDGLKIRFAIRDWRER
jgi:outer membrane lipoprotein LolB